MDHDRAQDFIRRVTERLASVGLTPEKISIEQNSVMIATRLGKDGCAHVTASGRELRMNTSEEALSKLITYRLKHAFYMFGTAPDAYAAAA